MVHRTLTLEPSMDPGCKRPIWAISGTANEEEKVMVTWISDIFIHIVDVLRPG